ncbi:MAG: DUF58 domain-containing protein [Pseudomonadota bacterium]
MTLLDAGVLCKIDTLALRARNIVEGALAGIHRSPYHGSSVEFSEHKEYSPGDEIRHIDWKACAKFDRYYVKRFEKETELAAYLVFDCSGSMAYPPPATAGHRRQPTSNQAALSSSVESLSKLEYAAHLAAALAYLLVRQQDRVGLFTFGGPAGPTFLPPRRASLFSVLTALETAVAESAVERRKLLGKQSTTAPGQRSRGFGAKARRRAGSESQNPADSDSVDPLHAADDRRTMALAAALDRVGQLARRSRTLVIVLSDMLDRAPEVKQTLQVLKHLRARGHDVSMVHLLHRDELELPFDGVTLFQSLEDDEQVLCDPQTVRAAYLKQLQSFLADVRQGCREGDIEYSLVPTFQPLERTLADFLSRRRSEWAFSRH